MTITKPVVTLTPKGKYITSASPEQKNFIIQPLTNTAIDTIYVRKAYRKMHKLVKELVTSGLQVICLLALNDDVCPSYDHKNASELTKNEIPVFACTPDLFPELMSAAIKKLDLK